MTHFRLRTAGRPVVGSLVGRLVALAVLIAIAAAHHVLPAAAAEARVPSGARLLMIADVGCPYCARWEREVGVAYDRSDEGRFAPIVRLQRGAGEAKRYSRVLYSPTFIVVRDGVEVGRLVGYPGADFFWGMLAPILEKAGYRAPAPAIGR
ncbi:MAG: hypothetical protein KDJ41_04220 [Hyphomicrobiaceae bacterium]|nr:hypothetical protein [Hyphomicrobiaceae bacterium]